jgi:hypothetical protein
MVVNGRAVGVRWCLKKWIHSASLASDSGSRLAAIKEDVKVQLCRHLKGNRRQRWWLATMSRAAVRSRAEQCGWRKGNGGGSPLATPTRRDKALAHLGGGDRRGERSHQ